MRINRPKIFICIALSVCLGIPIGCGTPAPMDPKLSDYVVAVDAWGRPLDPGKGLKLYGQDVPAGKPRGGIEEFFPQKSGRALGGIPVIGMIPIVIPTLTIM